MNFTAAKNGSHNDNSNTNVQNFDLKVENSLIKCKIQCLGHRVQTGNGERASLTFKSNQRGSQPVEAVDHRPSASVPLHQHRLSHEVLLENQEGTLCEEQRLSTKRQLSTESAAKSVSVRKRSTVNQRQEEMVKPLSDATPGTQSMRPYLPAVFSSRRKPRTLLFSSSDVFSKVDAFCIQKGKELREQQVCNAQRIAHAVTEASRNDLEKLRAIWIWLCYNIEYDIEGYLDMTPKNCSPSEVIQKGKGVCSGYSSICAEMCREMGIECVEVSGYSKGIGFQAGHSLAEKHSDHEWNAVFVDEQWWLLDACWGAGTVDMKRKTFVKRLDDFYFMTEPGEFINSHFPEDQTWQLLTSPTSMEEFEMGPLKTSAFYQLGLTLVQPTKYKTTTEGGEATVSISSSRPMNFSHEMRRRDPQTGDSTEEVDSSCGLLSVTHQGMKLRLLPPTSGNYEVKLFARKEGEAGSLWWVCNLELECPSTQTRYTIPDNPYSSWGLSVRAKALGVGGCSLTGEDALEVGECGECKVVLDTSRPLMMICELAHTQLDPGVRKRCLAPQITAEQLVCNILCLFKGFYRLSVFVRDHDGGSEAFQNVGNFLLHCRSQNPITLYPADLGLWCGPGIRTQEAGLSRFSHTEAIVNAPQGRCHITFYCASPDLRIHAALSAEQHADTPFPLSQYVFLTFTEAKVTVSVCTPRAGVYRLGIYGRKPPQQDHTLLCDYIIRSENEKQGDPFPCVYSAWGRGCVLLEPRTGALVPQTCVSFRVRVPGAQRVCVVGEKRMDLKMNKSRVWEGEAVIGNAKHLQLAAVTNQSNDMDVLLTFDVLNLENEP